ncbi:MAG: ISNCY family transposase [Nitrososphaerales archaeon]
MSLREAALVLSISYRQCQRKYKRYGDEGSSGIIHRLIGRASNRGIDPELKRVILDRYQRRYPDFGPTLASEKLALDGYKIDPETLRQWLIKESLWHKRRKRPRHRTWRQRRAHFGELVQMDGSIHRWFEDRAEGCCLMNMVDDATGMTMSLLDHEETTAAAMVLLWKWIEGYGIPAALYTDHKNVYIPSEKSSLKAQESGNEVLTQFGRACQKLGIRIITAHSPQAKGRVERSNGTYQDRLVKEMRLEEINDINSANQLLYGGFLDQLNKKFCIEPREKADFHRSALGYDPESIFCIEQERAITRDWIVRFENKYYQLRKQSKYRPASGKVLVRKYLNSELHFNYRGQDMDYEQLPQRPVPIQKHSEVKKRKKKHTPALDHAWRSSWKREKRA